MSLSDQSYHREVALAEGIAVGHVVIDSFLGGGGTGGIRLSEDVTREEVEDLAREMSLKFAWLNVARGGAKSGIRCPAGLDAGDRQKVLEDFGAQIADLIEDGRYVAGLDLGVGPGELRQIMTAAGIDASPNPSPTGIDSNYFTALTVYTAIENLLAADGRQVSGSTFLLEGLGKVGQHLAGMIAADQGRLVGVSTLEGARIEPAGIDVNRLLDLKAQHGDRCVTMYDAGQLLDSEALYSQHADVLIPGARTRSITEKNAGSIRARFIVPIANAVATPEVERLLHEGGVACVPGFVANSGGIFCWYLAKLSPSARTSVLRRGLGKKIRRLVERSMAEGKPIGLLARRQADQNARRMHDESTGNRGQRWRGRLRKLKPARLAYVVLSRLMGPEWASRDSFFARQYFDSRYFR